MTQEQKKMVFGCALGESITHPTWGSYPLLEEAIRKCDGQLSDIYVTDELISEFNAYVLKKAVATPPPQGLAKEQKEKIKQINELCGTVNFSSHNQMKEAIQGTVELYDEILASLAMEAAPQTDAVEFAIWASENYTYAENSMNMWDGVDDETYTTEQLYQIFKQNK